MREMGSDPERLQGPRFRAYAEALVSRDETALTLAAARLHGLKASKETLFTPNLSLAPRALSEMN
jgi:hypothetical protein